MELSPSSMIVADIAALSIEGVLLGGESLRMGERRDSRRLPRIVRGQGWRKG